MPARLHSVTLPRAIKPELVDIGDLVSVEFRIDKGVHMTHRGRVAKREDRGATRFMLTAEGGILFTWDTHTGFSGSIILLERMPAVSRETLPGMELAG